MHNASSSHGNNTHRTRHRSNKLGSLAMEVVGQRLEHLSLISSTPTATQDSISPGRDNITTPPNNVGQEKYMSLDTSLEDRPVASPELMDDLMVDVEPTDSMRMCLSSSPPSKRSTMYSKQPTRNSSKDIVLPAQRESGLRQRKKKTRGSQVHDRVLERNGGHNQLMIGLDDWRASWTERFSLDTNGNSTYPEALDEADLCELPVERGLSDDCYGNHYRLESDWEMRDA